MILQFYVCDFVLHVDNRCQDVVTSYVLGPNFSLKDLRCHKNRAKPFFDMTRADSPSSVFALEDNFGFVLTLAVTYAPDGCFPPHSHFKVRMRECTAVPTPSNANTDVHYLRCKCGCLNYC